MGKIERDGKEDKIIVVIFVDRICGGMGVVFVFGGFLWNRGDDWGGLCGWCLYGLCFVDGRDFIGGGVDFFIVLVV